MSFGTWEHLLPIVKNLHNYRVRDFWRHNRYDAFIADQNIQKTPRTNLMKATIILNDDSAVMAILKILLFEIVIGNAARLQPIHYGLPVSNFDEYTMEQRPQILLFFEEDIPEVPDNFSRVQAEINIRLMDETSETMNKSKAAALANRIKLAFGSIPTWSFTKGKYIYSYLDKKNGYWLRIYALNKSEAEEVIKKVLSIQLHAYDADNLKESHAPSKSSVNNPGTRIIYGDRTVKKKRYRPEKKVRFRYAVLKVDGLDDGIVLYDPYYRLNSADLAV